LRHIITGKESWFYLDYRHAPPSSVPSYEVPQRIDPGIGTAKFMLTVIWGINRFHPLDLMLFQYRLKLTILRGARYGTPGSDGLPPREDSVYSSTQCSSRQLLCSHLNNGGIVFIENRLLHVPLQPDRPDLAASDFWRFGRIKTELAGRSFPEPEELFEGVLEFLEGVPAAKLTAVSKGLIDRVRWVIAHNEQHYRN
jgi:hypothetical protein